ncbi:uncharacterized protein cubi_01210 [Cryptosporidium ubiquitum]|uniref:Uncharacterized protein n=1 Tax=Cryptosporidium ubiquitum TaxID=857276 RepID=A0A1J4MJI3_9CRYT|nr:uncharacterized protein cubi_01210 [Cryptosporidium ubiquitum]OII74366.1 hypothetical protein cubi_01210 [Cryptosporidium ubiquitum]
MADSDMNNDINTLGSTAAENAVLETENEVPLWAIITISILSCMLVCTTIAFLIIYFRERERTKTRERIEKQFRMAETKKLTRYLQALRERMMFRNHNAQMNRQPNPNFQNGFPVNAGPPRAPVQFIHPPPVGPPPPQPPPPQPPPPQIFNQMGHPINYPPQIQQPVFTNAPPFAPPVIPPQNFAPNCAPQPMNIPPPNSPPVNPNVTQGTISLTVHDPSLIPEGPPPIPPPGYVTVPIVLQNENH